MFTFSGHYKDWQISRLNCIKKYLGLDFFKDKSVHEVGCGPGFFGYQAFLNGAKKVTCSDGRPEYKELIDKNISFITLDCDGPINIEPVDVIVHFGLLYHIVNVKEHLQSLSLLTTYIILETEVCDNENENLIFFNNERGSDQSIHEKGSKPSPKYIENELEEAGFNFICIKDSILNTSWHTYDWEYTNNNSIKSGYRRFWICWKKNVTSPILKI